MYQLRAVISGDVHRLVLCRLSICYAVGHLLACTLLTGELYSVVNVLLLRCSLCCCRSMVIVYAPCILLSSVYKAIDTMIHLQQCKVNMIGFLGKTKVNLMYEDEGARTSTVASKFNLPPSKH